MKIAVIQFPGSNCERETCLAIERSGMVPIPFLWNEDPTKLAPCDGFVLVGGFSYEDRSRAGILAALDPVMVVVREQSAQGKPVLGICNGAQILVESGLVPGLPDHQVAMALTTNKRVAFDRVMGVGFYNTWVSMRRADAAFDSTFTANIATNDILRIPIAHAEGRFIMSQALLKEVQQAGLIAYQYCDDAGEVVSDFPVNPNGSIHNIAAMVNYGGNVMAMMPHPERTEQGDAIFTAMRDYIAEGEAPRNGQLSYQPALVDIQPFTTTASTMLVDTVVTDNVAMSVQHCLDQLAIPVAVERYLHWEVDADASAMTMIVDSSELYNPSKEFVVAPSSLATDSNTVALLVQENEDVVGQQKFQLLTNHFEVNGVKRVVHGVVWRLTAVEGDIQSHLKAILSHRVLFNPAAATCYYLT